MADKEETHKNRRRKNPAVGETSDDQGNPLNLGMFTQALAGYTVYDRLDAKLNSFATTPRSDMASVKDELKSTVATLQMSEFT